MRAFALCIAAMFSLFCPSLSNAQNTGRIECARSDGYVYLYSSLTTLDVRATLQCGEIVRLIVRSDNYFSVRNAKGETGFVPVASIVVLKDQVGTGLPAPAGAPARERTPYDERRPSAPAHPDVSGFTLVTNTPIRLKLLKTISSATAHAGDPVEFEVLGDIFVQDVAVLTKGSKVGGVVVESEPKKRFGRSGKVAISITSMRLADGEQAAVRCYREASGDSNNSAEAVLPLASGKDAAILTDTEFTALVDGDMHLKREAFLTSKDMSGPASAPSAQVAPPQP
jgi:hypothetical protein